MLIETNKIYNTNCFDFMNNTKLRPQIILTSPPYNTSKKSGKLSDHQNRYDVHLDNMADEQYIKWSIDLFNAYDKILAKNGVILYNISYANGKINKGKNQLMWLVVADIIRNTNFTTADHISWKKSSALPDNMTSNKCTRICESVFVFCRKKEIDTFQSNKKVVNIMPHNNCKVYDIMYNYIEAPNNSEYCNLNKAAFSIELCDKLLQMYAHKGDLVYDSFIGTGTTAVSAINYGCNYVGTELSKAQCEWAENRINKK